LILQDARVKRIMDFLDKPCAAKGAKDLKVWLILAERLILADF
jgi:hypothetical protein